NLVGTNQWEGIQLGHWPATVSTQHITIRHNAIENAQHAYGIAVRSGSSDIHVEANYVSMDANFEWVFGIATDRAVHDVTVTGNSDGAIVVGNVLHTLQWGILLGSDNAEILSNTIFDVDYAIYVPDSGSLPGVSSSAGTIYDTTAWGSAMGRIRLSPTFQGTVVDLGSGIRSTDLSAVVLQTSGPATRIAYAWSGRILNVSATVGAAVAFATASTE